MCQEVLLLEVHDVHMQVAELRGRVAGGQLVANLGGRGEGGSE